MALTIPKTKDDFFFALWQWKLDAGNAVPREANWSRVFEGLMRNRLIVGAHRYGPLGSARKPPWNRVESAIERLHEYIRTGNTELLVDVANLCLAEFVDGRHPNKHFEAVDDGKHVEKTR